MKKQSERIRLVTEALLNFPKSSKHTIAEVVYQNNKLLFKDKEDARAVVRYCTGSAGTRIAAKIIPHQTNFTHSNPFGLPPTEAKPFEPYILPKASNNILFLSDIHLPYHDINALTLALEYGKQKNVNTIYLNGDILDCYKASFHEQDPKNRDMAYELEQGRQFIDLLKREFPKAKIYYRAGNHELRWERFLRVKAPICLGMEEFRLSVLLKLGEKGVTWIENKQLVKMGKLNAIHGNEYKGGGGINVARTLWLRAGDNVIAGDKHKTQTGIKTTIDKSVVGSWSVGCLCDMNMDYLPFNEHNLGFAHITIESSGAFKVNNMMIIDGVIR